MRTLKVDTFRIAFLKFVKGLEDHIGLSVTHPVWQKSRPEKDEHAGWMFRDPSDPPSPNQKGFGSFDNEGCIPDMINGAQFVRDLYEMSNDTNGSILAFDFNAFFSLGKYSVPVLWDKKTKQIVNNESSEILRMFNSAFNELAKSPELDLYPSQLIEKIDQVNSWVYPTINNGVYRCGFAQSQEAYDIAFKLVRLNLLHKGLLSGNCLKAWIVAKRFFQSRDISWAVF